MPPPPEAGQVDRPPNHLRTFGIMVALSAPVSGFLLWIVVAVLIGEEQLEGESGQTGLGLAVLVAPLIVGIGIALWAHFAKVPPQITSRSLGAGLIGVGVVFVLLGLFSVLTESDASIGGGVLVLAGLTVSAGGWWVVLTRQRT